MWGYSPLFGVLRVHRRPRPPKKPALIAGFFLFDSRHVNEVCSGSELAITPPKAHFGANMTYEINFFENGVCFQTALFEIDTNDSEVGYDAACEAAMNDYEVPPGTQFEIVKK
jgi:hypothetical protein